MPFFASHVHRVSAFFLTLVRALIRRETDGGLATLAKPLFCAPGPILAAIPIRLSLAMMPRRFSCPAQKAWS
jgi:hypothetical protein